MTDQDLQLHETRPRTEVETGVIFALWAIILVALLAGLVRRAAGRRATPAAGANASPAGSGAGLLQDVRNFFSDAGVNEEMKAVVQERMTALKLARLRFYLHAANVAVFTWVLSSLVALARRSFPKNSTPAEDILWLVFEAFGAVVFVRPTLVTPKNLDVITVVILACASINHTPLTCCTEEAIQRSPGTKFLLVLGLNSVRGGGSRGDWLLLLLGNVIYLGCSTYTHWHIYRSEETWVDAVQENTLWMVLTALSFIVAATFDAGERRVLTQGLRLAEATEMHKAATALLRSTYDVIVELDSRGVVEGSSPELGSLLLRSNYNRSMQGVKLASLLIDEDDRNNFQRRLSTPRSKTVGLAENMHVSMKDSLGNTLRMEMMWFACERAKGLHRFVVGIREFSDQGQVAPGSGPGASQGHVYGSGAADYFPSALPVASEGSSSSEDAMSVSQPAAVDVDAAQAMIVLDLTAADRPIRGVTTGFRSNIGHVPRNASLSRIVRRPEAMVKWMESCVNSVVNGEPLPEDHSVTVQLPHGRMKARCRLVLTDEDAEAPPVDVEKVVVLFYNISQPRARSGSGSGTRHGTPATAPAHTAPAPDTAQYPSASADSPGEEATALGSV